MDRYKLPLEQVKRILGGKIALCKICGKLLDLKDFVQGSARLQNRSGCKDCIERIEKEFSETFPITIKKNCKC